MIYYLGNEVFGSARLSVVRGGLRGEETALVRGGYTVEGAQHLPAAWQHGATCGRR